MKKDIAIGVLFLFIVLLVFCILYLYKEKKEFVHSLSEQETRFIKNADVNCSGKIDPGLYSLGNNGCYFEYALQYESYGICNKINDSFRFDCLRMIANIKNDILGCEKIIPFNETQTPEDIKRGEGYNDISAQTQKEWCYWDIGFKNKDNKICEKINTAEINDKCQKCIAGSEQESLCYPVDRTPQHL